ncbi:hypothetical protein L6251_02050 [Candidatus Parcubacteria bacterium]|nr:hypothetical protein [Patescibacteria group bacterium]MBU4477216.1 hypothetical protein [Patescibacteria group bacterium]MCG2699181.1 hypothetical protein [Candidatus Parcubacteria bacterium]
MNFTQKEIITIVGYGWVGQANALSFSNAGYKVYYYDTGKPELRYADKYAELYKTITPLASPLAQDSGNTWYIICVGDRVSFDGEQDISAIQGALESLKNTKGGIVLRSTVLPAHLASLHFDYYVPEFLHEKKAVEECMTPQYFIVGSRDAISRQPSFFNLWQQRATKTFYGTPEEASYLKYLSNIWNALRVAFVNEFGNAMAYPVDKEKIAGIEKVTDFFFERKSYLRYGKSFGGHCLPKDTRAFFAWHKKQGKDMSLIEGMCKSNDNHQIIEKKYPHLPEWFSEWVRPQISGWVALRALKSSIQKKLKKLFRKT